MIKDRIYVYRASCSGGGNLTDVPWPGVAVVDVVRVLPHLEREGEKDDTNRSECQGKGKDVRGGGGEG